MKIKLNVDIFSSNKKNDTNIIWIKDVIKNSFKNPFLWHFQLFGVTATSPE